MNASDGRKSIKTDREQESISSVREFNNRSATESQHVISNVLPGDMKIKKMSFADEDDQDRLSLDLRDL